VRDDIDSEFTGTSDGQSLRTLTTSGPAVDRFESNWDIPPVVDRNESRRPRNSRIDCNITDIRSYYATRRGLLHGLIVLVGAPVKERTLRNQSLSFLVS
jgi:hypothetical protein